MKQSLLERYLITSFPEQIEAIDVVYLDSFSYYSILSEIILVEFQIPFESSLICVFAEKRLSAPLTALKLGEIQQRRCYSIQRVRD